MAHRAYTKVEFRSCCVRELFQECQEMAAQTANLPLINGHREKRWTENGPSQDKLDNFLMSGSTFNDLIPELITPVMGEPPRCASSPKRLKDYNELEVFQSIKFMDPLVITIPDEPVRPPHKDGGIVTMNGFATGLLKIAGRTHESSAEIRVCRKRSTGPRKQNPDRSSGVSRRRRFIYTEDQTSFLEQMFALGRYAGHSERVTYASIIGVSEQRIHVWFQNRRARERIQQRQAAKMHQVVT